MLRFIKARLLLLLRSRAAGGGDGGDGKCTASGDCIVGILRFLTITLDVKLSLAPLLARPTIFYTGSIKTYAF